VEYCCFIREAFPRFDLIPYGQQALSYLLVQATVNTLLIQVKLLRAVNRKPPSKYTMVTRTVPNSHSCLCERSLNQRRQFKLYFLRGERKICLQRKDTDSLMLVQRPKWPKMMSKANGKSEVLRKMEVVLNPPDKKKSGKVL